MSQKQRLFRLNSKSWSTSTLRSIANLLRAALYITKCGRTGNECVASCWIGVVLHWVFFMNLNICAYNISIMKPVVSRLHNELTPCMYWEGELLKLCPLFLPIFFLHGCTRVFKWLPTLLEFYSLFSLLFSPSVWYSCISFARMQVAMISVPILLPAIVLLLAIEHTAGKSS